MTELSIGIDGCSFAESLCFRGIVIGLRGVLSTAMSNSYVSEKNPAGATRQQQSPARILAQRRRAEIPNDRPQNARRGSLDVDHLDIDHLCKFCSRGRTFGLSGAVSRSGCVDWRTHARWQARPGAAGWRGTKQSCHRGLWINRQPGPINLGPALSPRTTSERTPASAIIVVGPRP